MPGKVYTLNVRCLLVGLTILAPLAFPLHLAARQTLWVGGRVGTLGVGADLAVVLNDAIALRGGAGLLDVNADLTSVSGLADRRTGVLTLPRSVYTLGVEMETAGIRLGGGMMYKSEDPFYTIRLQEEASIDIGMGSYMHPEVTRLRATVHSDPWAPYALIGFGRQRGAGLRFFLDLGVVLLDRSRIELSADGEKSVLETDSFRDDLRAETLEVRADIGDWVNYWPILSLGIRYGIGGSDRRFRENRRFSEYD